MNYLAALDQLDAIGESLAKSFTVPGWRLLVRPRGSSDTACVQLQGWVDHQGGGYWDGRDNVTASCRVTNDGLQLVTYTSFSVCGTWAEERERVLGLAHLFKVAEAFESFTAGKTFDPQ